MVQWQGTQGDQQVSHSGQIMLFEFLSDLQVFFWHFSCSFIKAIRKDIQCPWNWQITHLRETTDIKKIVQDSLDKFQQQTSLELTGYQNEEKSHPKLSTECFLTLNHLQSISSGSSGSDHGIPRGSLEPAGNCTAWRPGSTAGFGAEPWCGIN